MKATLVTTSAAFLLFALGAQPALSQRVQVACQSLDAGVQIRSGKCQPEEEMLQVMEESTSENLQYYQSRSAKLACQTPNTGVKIRLAKCQDGEEMLKILK